MALANPRERHNELPEGRTSSGEKSGRSAANDSWSSGCQASYLPLPLVTVPQDSLTGWFCMVTAYSLHFQLGGRALIFCPVLFTFPFPT